MTEDLENSEFQIGEINGQKAAGEVFVPIKVCDKRKLQERD